MTQHHDPSPAEPGPPPWFLVANGSRAHAYVRRIAAPGYDLVRDWDAPEARAHDAAMGEDRPGRLFPSAGATQRSGIEPEDAGTTPKGHAQHEFLERLVEDLTQALRRGALSGLFVLAPARMLHRLKAALPTDLRHAWLGEASGDVTQLPTADIFAHLDRLRLDSGGQQGPSHGT